MRWYFSHFKCFTGDVEIADAVIVASFAILIYEYVRVPKVVCSINGSFCDTGAICWIILAQKNFVNNLEENKESTNRLGVCTSHGLLIDCTWPYISIAA